MNEQNEFTVRRIVVAIDTSPHGSAALEAAAQLAAELRAELHGLFIEDAGLLRLAGLPFAIEIDDSSGRRRPLDLQAMEQSLRAKAEGVRRAVAEAAQRTSLRWSFRIARGNLAQTMLSESLEDELVLIGWEKASAATTGAPRGPVMIIDEGTPASRRVVETAQRLTRGRADAMIVLRSCPNPPLGDAVAASSCYFQRCSGDLEGLLHAVRQWRPQLLLLDRSSPLITEATMRRLVAELPCPLALVQ